MWGEAEEGERQCQPPTHSPCWAAQPGLPPALGLQPSSCRAQQLHQELCWGFFELWYHWVSAGFPPVPLSPRPHLLLSNVTRPRWVCAAQGALNSSSRPAMPKETGQGGCCWVWVLRVALGTEPSLL